MSNAFPTQDILAFWFGELNEHHMPDETSLAQWWIKSDAFDQEIRNKFSDAITLASNLPNWQERCSTEDLLALILCLDQFTRNVFRDLPDAYAFDTEAVEVAQHLITTKQHLNLHPIQRVFVYMPLEHAEDLTLQNRCVELFETLKDEQTESAYSALFENYLKFAIAHRDIIEQFSRFPHRNETLGRPSTPEEIDFLKQPNSSF